MITDSNAATIKTKQMGKQVITNNGIISEPYTHEERKVIAVEKDLIKLSIWNRLLPEFKHPDNLRRIAILEVFEEMGYPNSDMVKLYKVVANEA